MSYLVENTEDRFSRDEAQFVISSLLAVHFCSSDADCNDPHPVCVNHGKWGCHVFTDRAVCGCHLITG